MLTAQSPAVQARVDAYVRKPSLAPLHSPGRANARMAAEVAAPGYGPAVRLIRNVLVTAAIHELSTSNPED